MNSADLHIHTTASDGVLSPKEVLSWACNKGLKAVGITDHDTVGGIEEAIRYSKLYNVEVVFGIELSTEFNSDEIHILGYYIDYNTKWLADKLNHIKNARYFRAVEIIKKLNKMGINISIEQVQKISEGYIIGRPHIARAMVAAGYIDNIKTAFDKYIGKDCPAYVPRYKLTCLDAIKMVEQLGGVPVLAHPGLIKDFNIIELVIEMGVRGIEVYHSKHNEATTQALLKIASDRGLLITGGSDCHGVFVNNEPILGNVTVDYSKVMALKKESKYYKLEVEK